MRCLGILMVVMGAMLGLSAWAALAQAHTFTDTVRGQLNETVPDLCNDEPFHLTGHYMAMFHSTRSTDTAARTDIAIDQFTVKGSGVGLLTGSKYQYHVNHHVGVITRVVLGGRIQCSFEWTSSGRGWHPTSKRTELSTLLITPMETLPQLCNSEK
jgi:hypothetical protein